MYPIKCAFGLQMLTHAARFLLVLGLCIHAPLSGFGQEDDKPIDDEPIRVPLRKADTLLKDRNYPQAREFLQQATMAFDSLHSQLEESTQNLLAYYLYSRWADFHMAGYQLEKARTQLAAWEDKMKGNHRINFLIKQGQVELLAGKLEASQTFFEKALAHLAIEVTKPKDSYYREKPFRATGDSAKIMYELSRVKREEARLQPRHEQSFQQESYQLLEKACLLLRSLPREEQNRPEEKINQALYYRAKAFHADDLQQDDSLFYWLDISAQMFEQAHNWIQVGVNHCYIAEAYLENDDYTQAWGQFLQAWPYLWPESYETDRLPPMKEIADPASLLQMLTGKGKVAWYKYQADPKEAYWLEEGHQSLMLALQLIDQLRLDIPAMEIDSRKRISAFAAVAFEYHMQILFSLHQRTGKQQYLEMAFEVMERSKNLALLEEYLNHRPGEAWQDPRKFSAQDSASLYENWIPSIGQLQRTCLSQESAMLSYFIGENYSFLFAATNEEVRLVRLTTQFFHTTNNEPINRELLHQQIELLKKHGSDSAKYKNKAAYQQLAYLVFQELIQPVYELVQDKERLICIPDGPLYEFPIESLVVSYNSRKELFQQQDYLVNRHWVSYRLSGALWYYQIKEQTALEWPESLTAFFPTLGGIVNKEDSIRAFAPLYRLLSSIGSQTFLPKEATETTFKSFAPKTKVLLIFTHGTESGESGVRYLRFDMDLEREISIPEEENLNDGKLSMEEIYDLQLTCDLVMLVACEGAIGSFHPGEGNFSIARAFHHAGGTHLIAAIWQIPIESSARLLTNLLTFIEAGKPIDAALAMAKRELIQSRADGDIGAYYTPKDWGGLILFGNPPIQRIPSQSYFWIIGSLLGLILIFSFAYREKLLPLFRRDYFSS